MTFVNASLLAGAGFVLLPIVLHLVMRRKPKHFQFPALRFIQKRHEANRRRLQLRHLLLLLLRVAAIALLAFALARPSLKFARMGALGSQKAPVAAALVFDAASRMEYTSENQTRLDAARDWGLWLLAQFPAESEIAVIDTRLGSGAFQVDRGAARHRIERLAAVPNSQPLTAAVEEAARLLAQSRLAQREIYVLGDLARAAWPVDAAARLRSRLQQSGDIDLYVIDVGVAAPANTALGEVRLSGEVVSRQAPLVVESTIEHLGPAAKRTVEIHLASGRAAGGGEGWQKRGETIVDLAPGSKQSIEFTLGGLEAGLHQGYLEILGEDALLADNRRFFTVEIHPAWRVLLAAPEPAEDYSVYFAEAIAPSRFRRNRSAAFECDVVSIDALARQSLDGHQAVCLLDPTPLAPTLWKKLADFASRGGGVGIFLGRHAEPVASFNDPSAQELLPGPLVRQARAPSGEVVLAPQDYQHPLLEPFRPLAGSIPWESFPVYRYWQLGPAAAGVGTIVPLSNGDPAILVRSLVRGRVLTMTTAVSDRPNEEPWNLLPVGESWPFVILANRMATWLVGAGEQRLNYYAGQTASLLLDPSAEFRSYSLVGPDNVAVRVTPDLKRQSLSVTSTEEVGNYRLEAGGGRSKAQLGFSVNLAPEATSLDRLDATALDSLLGRGEYRLARGREELEGKVFAGRVGRELFPVAILLIAAVLGIEHLLANRFYRQ